MRLFSARWWRSDGTPYGWVDRLFSGDHYHVPSPKIWRAWAMYKAEGPPWKDEPGRLPLDYELTGLLSGGEEQERRMRALDYWEDLLKWEAEQTSGPPSEWWERWLPEEGSHGPV